MRILFILASAIIKKVERLER